MTYTEIKSLRIGDSISQVFLIGEVERKTTSKQVPFTRLTLVDKSGKVHCNVWNFDCNNYPEIKPGVYVSMTIEVQDYKGNRSISSNSAPMPVPAPENTTAYEDKSGLTDEQIEECYGMLMNALEEVKDVKIKTYLEVIFKHNDDLVARFKTAPASTSNRGAYKGGLVEHVLKVMANAMACMESQSNIAVNPAPINEDIVIAGVLTHDIGKAYAYEMTPTGARATRSGELLQHLPMSYGMSVQAFIQAESILRKEIPEEIKDHINHCILAHHGLLEYGSPVTPKSLEAQIVHIADMMDSQTSNFAEVTLNNRGQADDRGICPGNHFSSKKMYVGTNNEQKHSN